MVKLLLLLLEKELLTMKLWKRMMMLAFLYSPFYVSFVDFETKFSPIILFFIIINCKSLLLIICNYFIFFILLLLTKKAWNIDFLLIDLFYFLNFLCRLVFFKSKWLANADNPPQFPSVSGFLVKSC